MDYNSAYFTITMQSKALFFKGLNKKFRVTYTKVPYLCWFTILLPIAAIYTDTKTPFQYDSPFTYIDRHYP